MPAPPMMQPAAVVHSAAPPTASAVPPAILAAPTTRGATSRTVKSATLTTIPSNVTVVGPADGPRDGFAILVGTGIEQAILLGDGKLENLTFEGFAVAIIARGAGELESVRIGTSAVAVRAETTARLRVS